MRRLQSQEVAVTEITARGDVCQSPTVTKVTARVRVNERDVSFVTLPLDGVRKSNKPHNSETVRKLPVY